MGLLMAQLKYSNQFLLLPSNLSPAEGKKYVSFQFNAWPIPTSTEQ